MSDQNPPLVTVLMPTYNSELYLAEAIRSILEQSWRDLELVVLDGGSIDATADIVRALARRDPRLSIEISPGLHPTKRVDTFIRSARSRLIALQHSDDISYRHRISWQVEAFKDIPDLGVCSGMYRSFYHDRTACPKMEGIHIHQKPETHDEIKAQLPFWWVMHSSTLMIDREKGIAAGLKFSNEFEFCNDYWQSVENIQKLKYHNIQKELAAYRIHLESDAAQNSDKMKIEFLRLKQKILDNFGFSYTDDELAIHVGLDLLPENRVRARTIAEFDATEAWLENLRVQNQDKKIFDAIIFSTLISDLVRQLNILKHAAFPEIQLAARYSASERQRELLEIKLDAAETELAIVSSRLDFMLSELSAVFESRSWRLTKPVRKSLAWLRRVTLGQ
ncbi:MAG: glycosyltransferase family A protein [Acidocella sp.]|nr:glycosyltransferase family A protein [Acidocella sp.]